MNTIDTLRTEYLVNYDVSYRTISYIPSINGVSVQKTARSQTGSLILDDATVHVPNPLDISIPISVMVRSSVFESVVVYLKDRLGLKFSSIAGLLNRDQRTIWASYANAKKKNLSQTIDTCSIYIPVDIFASRKLSTLETLILYLKTTHDMSFNMIAEMLGKNYQTVWTVYKRGIKKLTNE